MFDQTMLTLLTNIRKLLHVEFKIKTEGIASKIILCGQLYKGHLKKVKDSLV